MGNETERSGEAMPRPVGERIWECKIGAVCKVEGSADFPMRRAVEAAFLAITGVAPKFIFSGWGGALTDDERIVAKCSDPLCPCQDGDVCHYEGKDAWPPRQPPSPDAQIK